VYCRSLLVLLSFFFWSWSCLFFFNWRILITLLVSSNSSKYRVCLYLEDMEWQHGHLKNKKKLSYIERYYGYLRSVCIRCLAVIADIMFLIPTVPEGIVIVWLLDLPVQAVHNITNVVSSYPIYGEVYSIQLCQWLMTGRWFSLGTPVSSTNKTDRHDTTEILLKVVLNNINQSKLNQNQPSMNPFQWQ
jgi:hypothetical protein